MRFVLLLLVLLTSQPSALSAPPTTIPSAVHSPAVRRMHRVPRNDPPGAGGLAAPDVAVKAPFERDLEAHTGAGGPAEDRRTGGGTSTREGPTRPTRAAPSSTEPAGTCASAPASTPSAAQPAPSSDSSPRPQSVLTRPLPGRSLQVHPVGLIVVGSALGLLALVTAYMTYERAAYRAQFRARRTEAARRGARAPLEPFGASMAAGGAGGRGE
ncbi:hypothetical protein JCM3770_001559 [Rhodotorula araucariae]